MAWTKAPQSLVELFDESLPDDFRIERRRMFGFPGAFVHGNMFAGVFQDQIFARLSPEDRAALEAEHGPCPFTPMPGRGMGSYARLPDAVMEDEAAVAAMLARALSFAAALPDKVRKARKTRQT